MTIFGKRYIREDKLKAILAGEYDFYKMCHDGCFEKALASQTEDDRREYSTTADKYTSLMYCVASLAKKIEKGFSAKIV